MSYENKRPDVAVFIDFENVYVSVRDKLNANPNFEAIMDRCSDLGRVVLSRAYADWYRYPRVTSALYANAIEPIYVATYYYDKDMGRTGRAIKNSVDMNLCIDAMKTLFTNTNIAKFVLVTGDRDFIPLVNSIRQQGKEVYIIGIGGAASTHLAQSADEFVFYEQLVGKQAAGSAAATAIANRATELHRTTDIIQEPAVPIVPALPALPVIPIVPALPVVPTASAEVDVYAVLVEAIHLVRKRGYVSTLGSIKLVMKELMGGDFKESRYKDLNGRPFAKFKDFVMDAEKRGKVQIFTNGTVNEVFLPGEDALKLSQFAAALTDDTVTEPVSDATILSNGRKEPVKIEPTPVVESPTTPTGRRRRRRSRRGQGGGAVASSADLNVFDPLDQDDIELELTPPILDDEPILGDPVAYMDGLRALDDVEGLPAIEMISDEQTADELAIAGMPADELLDELDEEFGFQEMDEFEPDLVIDSVLEDEAIAEAVIEAAAVAEILDEAEVVVEIEGLADLEAEAEPEGVAEAVAEPELVAAVVAAAAAEAEAAAAAEPSAAVEFDAAAEFEVATEPEVAAEPEAAAEPEVAVEPEAEAATDIADDGEVVDLVHIEFSNEEWNIFREMMRGFSKPVSFQQIFDALRSLRKDQSLTRTNEQLRTMVKQAINTSLLERSGKGKRVYYTLKIEE